MERSYPIKLICILLMTWGHLANNAYSQQPVECHRKVQYLYHKMSLKTAPQKGRMHQLTMILNNRFRDSANYPMSSSELRIEMGHNYYIYQSDQMDFYKDDEHVFWVAHSTQTIIRTTPEAINDNALAWDKMYQLRDSLINESKVTGCQKISANQLRITLIPPEQRQMQTHVAYMVFDINTLENTMQSLEIYYTRDHHVYRSKVDYHDCQFDQKTTLKNVLPFVLDKRNEPVPKFGNYQLIDQRNKQ